MIARREEEIRKFVPQPYYGIQAKCASPALTLTWQDGETKSFRSFDRARMDRVLSALQGLSLIHI